MDQTLQGWKKISAYLDCNVRTAQRWANQLGLPVRFDHSGRASAQRSELDDWRRRNKKLSISPKATADGSARRADEVDRRSRVELLRLFYADVDLKAHGLFRFRYRVKNDEVTTNMASSRDWLNLSVPITELSYQKFPIEERLFKWPVTSQGEKENLIRELEKKSVMFHNKPIYCLQSFNPHGQTIASFSVAEYIDYKIGLGRLEEELTRALVTSELSPQTAFQKRFADMPLRNKLLPNSEVVADYASRLCAGGTNILLAMRVPHDEGFVFFLKRRSIKVSTGRRMFSLVPSGMHQPTSVANAQQESSIASTVYREMYEELFQGKDAEGPDRHLASRWFMSKPQLTWLVEHPDKVVLEIVSFGLNLVDGTFEFGVLLMINDPSFWRTFLSTMELNDEFDDYETSEYSTLDSNRLFSALTDPFCADQSLIVLVQGLQRLKEIEPNRVALPDIEVFRGGRHRAPKLPG